MTEAGERLLGQIGHTEQTQSYLLAIAKQTSLPLLVILLAVGVLFAMVILGGAARFFCGREQVYEDAGRVIGQYAANRFVKHLPSGESIRWYLDAERYVCDTWSLVRNRKGGSNVLIRFIFYNDSIP